MKPTAIITADLHIRETKPRNRTDDFWKTQERKIKFVLDLQNRYYNIPILDGGDFLDSWESSPYLENWIIRTINKNSKGGPIITVPGNHDTPNHSVDRLNHSSLVVLEAAEILNILQDISEPIEIRGNKIYGFPQGKLSDVKELRIRTPKDFNGRKILIMHIYTCKQGSKWYDLDSTSSRALLRNAKQFDLIITGHNHESFVVESEGRLLVNPGSLMRSTTKQINHKPRVYLWYDKDNHVEPVFVPIEKDVLSIEEVEEKRKEDKRMDSFVSKLNNDYEIELSYKNNLRNYIKNNKVRRSVENLIWESTNNEN